MGQPQKTSGTVRFEVYSTRNSLTQMQQWLKQSRRWGTLSAAFLCAKHCN